jgi:hypothetical protein
MTPRGHRMLGRRRSRVVGRREAVQIRGGLHRHRRGVYVVVTVMVMVEVVVVVMVMEGVKGWGLRRCPGLLLLVI